MERRDRVADRGQHPLHLVLSALVEGQLEPRWLEAPDPRGRGHAVVELHPLGEPGQRLVVGLALDLRLVDLVHLVARVHEPVRERPVVREQEDAGRVRVEPPHRHDAPLMGDEAHDGRPSLRVAGGRDDARGLVRRTYVSGSGATSAPSTSTRSAPSTNVARPATSPFTVTRPARISSSAPRREAMPARAR